MKKNLFFFFCLFPIFSFCLEEQPWFGNIYEFHLTSSYSYSYYDKVNGAIVPLSSTSHDHLLYFDLDFPFSSRWSFDTDLEFTRTPRQPFSFCSFALQFRHLWSDDIGGDAATFTTGASFRYIAERSKKDISCPYHGDVEFEGNLSLGKEFDRFDDWFFRLWCFAAIGIANIGSPWFRGIGAIEGNFSDTHRLGAFVYGGHGYGKKTSIDISNFNGYGRERQKYIDLSFRYGYHFRVAGTLRFEYTRRLLSKVCPSEVNTFTLSYLLPFSF